MNTLKINRGVLIAIAGLLVLSISVGFQLANARELYNDPVTATADAIDNVAIKLVIATETTATSTLMIDRSDTTNWPHSLVGATGIQVAQMTFDWSAESNATTTLKVGVIASSTASGNVVDVYWFDEVSFTAQDLTGTLGSSRQSQTLSYSPSVIDLALSSGVPSKFLTNDSSLSTSDFATTTPLLSPNGYVAPAVGDLVLRVYDQKGTATTSVTTLYRTR